MIFYKFHLEINERKILIGDEKIPIFAIRHEPQNFLRNETLIILILRAQVDQFTLIYLRSIYIDLFELNSVQLNQNII